jgi:arginase family enzyme
MGRVHDIILMIDLGDLREGIWPNDLIPTVERRSSNCRACASPGSAPTSPAFGAIIPTEENLGQLVAYAYKVRKTFARRSRLGVGRQFVARCRCCWRAACRPASTTCASARRSCRAARHVPRHEPWRELDRDAFKLTGDLLEVKIKPSLPIGKSGVDAFGNRPVFVDEGERLRGIANIGREDAMIEGLCRWRGVIGCWARRATISCSTSPTPSKPAPGRRSRQLPHELWRAADAMTSEYVEKAPMHDITEVTGRRMVSIVADSAAGPLLARQSVGTRLEQMQFDVIEIADAEHPPAGLIRLHAGADRHVASKALTTAAEATHSLGLIWIDSIAALMPEGEEGVEAPERSVLARLLGLDHKPGALQPQLSPENVVLVGLREADPAEVRILKDSRVTAFTMAEVDGSGMREVMREAIRIASSGTVGFHVSYSPTATEIPGWASGSGGMTVRETHQAMEAIALSGGMLSMDVSGLAAETEPRVATEAVNFVMSAFGKRIL